MTFPFFLSQSFGGGRRNSGRASRKEVGASGSAGLYSQQRARLLAAPVTSTYHLRGDWQPSGREMRAGCVERHDHLCLFCYFVLCST